MFYFPMAFMLIVTLTSLVFTIKAQIGLITTGADVTWGVIRAVIAVLLIILAIDLVIEGVKALSKQAKGKDRSSRIIAIKLIQEAAKCGFLFFIPVYSPFYRFLTKTLFFICIITVYLY